MTTPGSTSRPQTIAIPVVALDTDSTTFSVTATTYLDRGLSADDARGLTGTTLASRLGFAAHVHRPLIFSGIAVGLSSTILGVIMMSMQYAITGSVLGVLLILCSGAASRYLRSHKARLEVRTADLLARGVIAGVSA